MNRWDVTFPDFAVPANFIFATFIFLIILIIRYVILAGFFHLYFLKFKKEQFVEKKISKKEYPKAQFITEIKWSFFSSVIFAVTGVITLLLWQKGLTSVYHNLYKYGIWYLPISLFAAMVIHEVYYYWVHRWMHHPRIFRKVHKVHHNSFIPSPWTAFSFHPFEALLEAIILPVILIIVPLHPVVIFIYLILMSFSSVINHLDIEIYPKGFEKHRFGKWLIGATHHSLHHKEFKTNYGLYFTFMDKWFGTESKSYNKK